LSWWCLADRYGFRWLITANQLLFTCLFRNAQDFWKVNYLEKLLRDAEDLGIIESAKDERVPFARSALDAAPALPQWYASLLSCRNPVAVLGGKTIVGVTSL
jgi:hypothetical protein